MIVEGSNKFRKIIKFGINFVTPIVLLIYSITILLNSALFSNVLGESVISYRLAIISSVGISVLITVLFYISKIFQKNSFKRNVNLFVISLLMLIDCYMWANFSVFEIRFENVGSFSIDSSFIFIGLLILLSINTFLKAFDLFLSSRKVNSESDFIENSFENAKIMK